MKMSYFLSYSYRKRNYATKSDLKNATGVDTSQFAKKMIYLTSNQRLTN